MPIPTSKFHLWPRCVRKLSDVILALNHSPIFYEDFRNIVHQKGNVMKDLRMLRKFFANLLF